MKRKETIEGYTEEQLKKYSEGLRGLMKIYEKDLPEAWRNKR